MHLRIDRVAMLALSVAAAAPTSAATVAFSGTRQNVNFISPAGTGRCAPLNTVTITPTGPSSSGTSNLGSFVLTHSHCIPGAPNPQNPAQPITDGLFTWDFDDGGSIFGTYSGTASFANGVATGQENLVITGGTGRFDGATGAIASLGQLSFGQVDGRPVGIFNGTVTGTITAAGIPEPAGWAMMIAGFAAIGFAGRRRVRVAYA